MDWKKRFEKAVDKRALATGACIVAVYEAFNHASAVLSALGILMRCVSPLAVGVLFAAVFYPLYKKMSLVFSKIKNEKLARVLSFSTFFLTVAAALSFTAWAIVPELSRTASELAAAFNWSELEKKLPSFLRDDNFALAKKIKEAALANAGSVVEASRSFANGAVTAVLGFVFSMYYILEEARIRALLQREVKRFSKGSFEKRWRMLSGSFELFSQYMMCTAADAVAVAVASWLFCFATGYPYPLLVSVLVGLTNVLPVFGPVIGGALGCCVGAAFSPGLVWPFLIFTVILQAVDGYVVKPRLFGSSLGMPPLVALVGIVVGGRLFGFWGIFLGVPFIAIVQSACAELSLEKEKVPEEPHADEELPIAKR